MISKSRDDENMKPKELQAFMNHHGISRKELCELLGVSVQAVTLWINNKREINMTITRLIRLFHKYPRLLREF